MNIRPENNLESAICEKDTEKLLIAVAEEEAMFRLAYAGGLDENFSEEVIFAVLLVATPKKLLESMNTAQFRHYHNPGERLQKLTAHALAPLPENPTTGESALIKAIVNSDDTEISRLILEEGVKFNGFAPELLLWLPTFSADTLITFLKDGLSAKLKAIVLGILLKEVEKPNLFQKFSYQERVRFANIMLQIMMKHDMEG